MLKLYLNKNKIEAGIDEAGRGPLIGRVYAACVIWPNNIENKYLKDSKKLTKKKRLEMRKFIEDNCIDFGIGFCDHNEIDKINILQASHLAMHKAINNLRIIPEHLLVDGPNFKFYINKENDLTPHTCIINGDAKYVPN